MLRILLAIGVFIAGFGPVSAENPAHVVSLKQTHACAGCDLSGAHLRVARLAGADLAGADLSRADLISADLGRANLAGANLSNANLIRASLVGATLHRTRFDGANLTRTHIEGTDLRSVIGLTQAQLSLACGNANTQLPRGLTVKPCTGSEL